MKESDDREMGKREMEGEEVSNYKEYQVSCTSIGVYVCCEMSGVCVCVCERERESKKEKERNQPV